MLDRLLKKYSKKNNVSFLLHTLFFFTFILFSSCTSFSIKPQNLSDARVGKDYVLTVRAWDKNNQDLAVTIFYRINEGPWITILATKNGDEYSALVPANELVVGELEYKASMKNAKGKQITSKSKKIAILTFEQAKAKALLNYTNRLIDNNEISEIPYNESASLELRIKPYNLFAKMPYPLSVECFVTQGVVTTTLAGRQKSDFVYEVSVTPPYDKSELLVRWRVRWLDTEFGELETFYPLQNKKIKILSQLAINNRIRENFFGVLQEIKSAKGSFETPPRIEVALEYDSFLEKYSMNSKRVYVVLYKPDGGRLRIPLNQGHKIFWVDLPVEELERGALWYSYEISDFFKGPGFVQAVYPGRTLLEIQYTNKETLLKQYLQKASGSFVHKAPESVIQKKPLVLKVDFLDASIQVESVKLESSGFIIPGNTMYLSRSGDSWYCEIPSASLVAGSVAYRFVATVKHSTYGSAEISIPQSSVYSLTVYSEE